MDLKVKGRAGLGFAVSIAAICASFGCATTFVRTDFVPVEGKLEAPRLVPFVEPTALRIDLIHRKTIRSSKTGITTTVGYAATDGTTTETVVMANTEAEEVEYSPVCFDLGNGLTLDTNGNLFFNPKAFIALEGDSKMGDSNYEIDVHNGVITQRSKDLFATTKQFEIVKNELFDLSAARRPIVTTRKDSYYLTTYNMFGAPSASQVTTVSGNRAQFRMERTFDPVGTSTLSLDGSTLNAELKFYLSTIKLSLSNEGDRVRLKYSTPTLNYDYTIQRSADALVVSNPRGYGMKISIDDDRLLVDAVWEPDPIQALFGGNRTQRTIWFDRD